MGHPPEPACGCRPKNCSSRKNPFFLRARRAGMGTACAGRGWPHRKQDFLAGQRPPWLHVGQNQAPGTEFIPPRRRPFIVMRALLQTLADIGPLSSGLLLCMRYQSAPASEYIDSSIERRSCTARSPGTRKTSDHPDQRRRLAGVRDSGRPGQTHHDNHLSPLPHSNLQELPSQD